MGGGFSPGIVEIWGGPGTGKTTLAQHTVNELEPTQDALWMSIGAEIPHRNIRASMVSCSTAEGAFSIMQAALQMRAKLVVVDSANGLVRSREIEGSPDYDPWYTPSPHREYKSELRDLEDMCSVTSGTVLFLSKPRDVERTPIRGTGISEKAKQRLMLKIVNKRQDGTMKIEASTKSGDSCEYVLRPGTGIDWAEEVLRYAVDLDIVSVRGSWYSLPGKTIQGKDEAAEYIREYPKLAAYLYTEVRADLGIG